MNHFLWEYLCMLNIAGFVLFGYDKFLAKARQRRISERTLLLVAALGGSIGSYIGMMLFRHKTRRLKFRITIPLFFLLQLFLAYFLWKQGILQFSF